LGVRVARGTLTEEQFDTTGYGQFNGTPTRRELERFFFLDDADRRLVAKRRGDHNRLGFALQVVTARYVGTFLADPLDVPTEVVDYVAKQSLSEDTLCRMQRADQWRALLA
jgi:TnpA family transposase